MERDGFVSIVVPMFNSENTIQAALRSLSEQNHPHEIIVVDGGSSDRTLSLLGSDARVSVAKGNQAVAMNTGINLARGSLVAFVDSDCIAPRGWLERMVNVLKQEKAAAVFGGNTVRPDDPLISRLTWRIMGSLLGSGGTIHARTFNHPRSIEHVPSYNALYVRQVLLDLGGFDEELGGAEDVEIGKRLLRGGYRMVYAPGGEVWHKGRDNLTSFWRQMRGFGWSKGRLFRRDISHLRLVHLSPLILALITLILTINFPLTPFLILLILIGYGIKFSIVERDISALPLTPAIFVVLIFGWSFGLLESLQRGANPKDRIQGYSKDI